VIGISFDKAKCFGQYGAAVPQFKERVMELPHDRLYSEYHLWVKLEKDQAVVGITDYAREELGEVDYIELPQVDDILSKNRPFGIVETSKAVTDLVAPISGIVVESNNLLSESPETLTDDPYGDGWLIIVEPSDPDEIDELMSHKVYDKLVKSQEEE
jgi:glycine cleavage system H protein